MESATPLQVKRDLGRSFGFIDGLAIVISHDHQLVSVLGLVHDNFTSSTLYILLLDAVFFVRTVVTIQGTLDAHAYEDVGFNCFLPLA